MWQPEQVERALFLWKKWRCSLIHQWMSDTALYELPLNELRRTARDELEKLGLRGSLMAFYWICSVASECNLDYEASFEKIVIPSFALRFDRRLGGYCPKRGTRLVPLRYGLTVGARVYPPGLLTEKNLERRQSELSPGVYLRTDIREMLLPPRHELQPIIRKRKSRQIGRPPKYSDRLAVKCASLKLSGKTYVQIAEQLGLPVTRPFSSNQSDVVRHLVRRGKKLIYECSCFQHKSMAPLVPKSIVR